MNAAHSPLNTLIKQIDYVWGRRMVYGAGSRNRTAGTEEGSEAGTLPGWLLGALPGVVLATRQPTPGRPIDVARHTTPEVKATRSYFLTFHGWYFSVCVCVSVPLRLCAAADPGCRRPRHPGTGTPNSDGNR